MRTFAKKIEEDGARPNLGLDFVGVWGDFWKIEHLSFQQNVIIEDRTLKFKYRILYR